MSGSEIRATGSRRWERSREIVRARELRKNPTQAEILLWQALRRKQLNGLKFRRQAPLGPYIADFACLSKRLVIELDGAQHNDPGRMHYDEGRTLWLKQRGFRVLRFTNIDVGLNLDLVLATIEHECGG
jgi:very-short-patch-repair endonuclease